MDSIFSPDGNFKIEFDEHGVVKFKYTGPMIRSSIECYTIPDGLTEEEEIEFHIKRREASDKKRQLAKTNDLDKKMNLQKPRDNINKLRSNFIFTPGEAFLLQIRFKINGNSKEILMKLCENRFAVTVEYLIELLEAKNDNEVERNTIRSELSKLRNILRRVFKLESSNPIKCIERGKNTAWKLDMEMLLQAANKLSAQN